MKMLLRILCFSFLGISATLCVGMPGDVIDDSTYNSLSELKKKASFTREIKFAHGLSEFTYSKMNEETRAFFMKHGGLVDENSNLAPHVKMIGDVAIDTQSRLYRSHFDGIRLGQNILTKEFLAFKPVLRELNGVPAHDSQEVVWLKYFGKFRGVLDHFQEPELCHVAMNLIDGLNFMEMKSKGLLDEMNQHARYLTAYNLVQAFKDFKTRSIQQMDRNDSNFMFSVADFGVNIIDFEYLEKTDVETMEKTPSDRARFYTSMISQFFLADHQGKVSEAMHAIKKYQHGTFEPFVAFIGKKLEENNAFIEVDDIIKVLPNLQ